MAKRKAKKEQANTIPSSLFLIGGIVLLIVAAVGVFALLNTNSGGKQAGQAGPRLAVSQERIDFGKQPFDKMVRAEFQVKNEGDQVLTLDASTPIRAVEGC